MIHKHLVMFSFIRGNQLKRPMFDLLDALVCAWREIEKEEEERKEEEKRERERERDR